MKIILLTLIPLILSIGIVSAFADHMGSHHNDDSMGQHEMMKNNMMGNHHMSYKGMCAPGFTSLDGICVLDDRCGPGAYAGRVCMMDGVMKQYLKPHHQKHAGISNDNIICAEGKQLMFKHHNAAPACINSNSVEKLKHRGWTTGNPAITNSMDDVDFFHSTISSKYEIIEKAKAILDYAMEKEQSEPSGQYIEGPTDDGYQIIFYDVSENNLILNELPSLPPTLLHWQQDTQKHQEIWNVFTKLIPENQRNVNVFYITTDGIDAIGGGVERDGSDLSKWHLFYDISDAYPTEVIDDNEIIYTTIHEFGHIVTSGSDQIDVDLELVNFLDSNDIDEEELNELFQIKSEICYPQVMVADGCAKQESYINLFYQKFWPDIISDWDDLQYIEDEDEFLEQSDLFYDKYQNQFLTVYASTNIDEDIAESWTLFVLDEKPTGEILSDQKILFFYDFKELVDLREHIRNGLQN